jgi:hypothetical protein
MKGATSVKLIVTFKDPDAVADALKSVPEEELAGELLDKFVEYGEYVRLEFDTEAKTARVVPVKEH